MKDFVGFDFSIWSFFWSRRAFLFYFYCDHSKIHYVFYMHKGTNNQQSLLKYLVW